ncbi:MAG: hypothetical protein RI897_4404 [Verrucomicrobiota bacterium]
MVDDFGDERGGADVEAAAGGHMDPDGGGFGVITEELLCDLASGAEVDTDVVERVVMEQLEDGFSVGDGAGGMVLEVAFYEVGEFGGELQEVEHDGDMAAERGESRVLGGGSGVGEMGIVEGLEVVKMFLEVSEEAFFGEGEWLRFGIWGDAGCEEGACFAGEVEEHGRDTGDCVAGIVQRLELAVLGEESRGELFGWQEQRIGGEAQFRGQGEDLA